MSDSTDDSFYLWKSHKIVFAGAGICLLWLIIQLLFRHLEEITIDSAGVVMANNSDIWLSDEVFIRSME